MFTYEWNLIKVYCELYLVLSTFSPKQSTVSFFIMFHFLNDSAKKMSCSLPRFSHLSDLQHRRIFLCFFLLVIDTPVSMKSSNMDLESGYSSWILEQYVPTRCHRGSTGNVICMT